ncbi:MAG: dTMP kinase [Actinomycetota bacterium]|nr:dTMP kinase [Actinomycetota bacterium]
MPQQQPDLRLLTPADEERSSYKTLLKNRNYLRFFLAQAVSSLGDWIGVIAIAVFARRVGGGDWAVGAVMTARVLPGFIAGPIGGVLADSWDRKKTMVVADISRAAIIFSLPFFPNLVYLLVASVLLESLTLIWGPAKDASLPNFVPPNQLIHANSLSLFAVYAPWPLASIAFLGLSSLGGFLGAHVPVMEGLQNSRESLAFWIDSLTFVFSAVMISSLTIASSRRRAAKLNLKDATTDLVEGLRFVRGDRRVRPWLLGIAFTFTAAGGVFSLGVGFVTEVLGASQDRGFASLIGFLATGMILGLLLAGPLAKRIQKDVMFSSSILMSGVSLIAMASMNSLNTAIPMASALGFFGGVAYSTGYSLIQERTADELRGRTFSAAYTLIRIGTLVGLGLFPFLAGAIGDHVLSTPLGDLNLPGSRTTLWIAGLFAIGGALFSMRAIGEGGIGLPGKEVSRRGYFVVFEGGEGAGKSTQIVAFTKWLDARGADAIQTREPGGTAIGRRIREVLLDPGSAGMDERTEALLYAADRAQHVAEVIKPALDQGKVVVSDRFIDSSLAYQGLARGLGVDEILRISEWATGGLMPDLVLYMKVDPEVGLRRADGERDRIEAEAADFHERVGEAYLQLALKFPGRFVVLDASGSQEQVHEQIVHAFQKHHQDDDVVIFGGATSPPGPPVPR